MNIRSVIDAVLDAVRKDLVRNPPDDTVYGTYVSADATAGMHIISVNGLTISGVKAYSHVVGLTAGVGVECLHTSKTKPLTIVGTLAASATTPTVYAPLFAYKTANETVTSNTTLQSDDHLFLSVVENARYTVELCAILIGDDTADLKYRFTYPPGATLAGGQINLFDTVAGGASTAGDGNFRGLAAEVTPSTALNAGTADANLTVAWYKGLLLTDTSAGTLQLQWAQINSVAVATGLTAGSYLRLDRVA